jgi:hypothetical protein
MKTLRKMITSLAGGLAALAAIGWAGLQVRPQSFPPTISQPQDLGSVAVPTNLPAPVRRYLLAACGERIPRVESMVAWGTARANFGLWMPLRFQLYHRPGHSFERDMEVTWFGLPVLKALDRYVNGKGVTGPVNNLDSGPHVDQGANLILWAEATFYPSLLLTDPRIHWEAINATSARLHFPFGDEQDDLIFHFDPVTGLVRRTAALRYQGKRAEKEPWFAETLTWQRVNGVQLPRRVAVTWENQGQPWSYWDFEGVRWNVAVDQLLPTSAAGGAVATR